MAAYLSVIERDNLNIDLEDERSSLSSRSSIVSSKEKSSGRKVVQYCIEVIQSQESWQIHHRFSDFLRLRKKLIIEGCRSLPSIHSNSSVFSRRDFVLSDRSKQLSVFIGQLIAKIGCQNRTLNTFLGFDDKERQSVSGGLHGDGQREDTAKGRRTAACEAAQQHVQEHRVSWNQAAFHRTHSVLLEMGAMRRQLRIMADLLQSDSSSPFAAAQRHGGALSAIVQTLFHLVLLVTAVCVSNQLAISHVQPVSVCRGCLATLALSVSVSLLSLADLRRTWSAYLSLSCVAYTLWIEKSVPLVCVALLRLERVRRILQIYLLGISLVMGYGTVYGLTKLLRLSPTQVDWWFGAIDSVVAPYLVNRLGALRSIFIKFAQYIGGRNDMVSAHWSAALSRLHDDCPHSSSEYVRRTVEESLLQGCSVRGKRNPVLEDVFESFDMQPIASASIAQVHVATVRLSTLRNNEQLKTALLGEEATGVVNNTWRTYGECTNPLFAATKSSDVESSNSASNDEVPLLDSRSSFSLQRPPADLISVVVKVQHEHIARTMSSDMRVVIFITQLAVRINSQWETFLALLRGWQQTMHDELDFRQEAANLREMAGIMRDARLGSITPLPVCRMASRRVLVMTRLHGFKVTDKLVLDMHAVDKQALLVRIAHSCAWQLLVAGVFNADPHPGNIMFCLSSPPPSAPRQRLESGREGEHEQQHAVEGDIVPGLLDFGMTVRLKAERRKAYCRLVVALFEGDMAEASAALASVGYRSNQSERVPERDAEFFEFLLRDANPKSMSLEERAEFNSKRDAQKAQDIADGTREKGGRRMAKVPDDFIFLTRVIGLLRGLTAELDVNCPILYILALNARIGMNSE
eukprot:gene23848-30123_t